MGFRLKWLDALTPVGIVLLFIRFVSQLRLPGSPNYYVALGLILIATHIVLRFDAITSLIGRRQLRYGSNMAVLILAVVAILIVVNVMTAKRAWRWDYTKEQRFALSDQTKKIVRGLKSDLKMIYLLNPEEQSSERGMKDRMREYQALSSHIQFETVNIAQKPSVARQYGITGTTLIVQLGERHEKVMNTTEQDITNAILKVTRENKKTVCFVQGEGEKSIDETGMQGLSTLKDALEAQFYSTQSVAPFGEQKRLEPCSALVVAGPAKDLLPENVERLRRYVQDGGKALILIDPEFKEAFPNLTGLLKEWNIDAGKDVILQIAGYQLTPRGLQPVADEAFAVKDYPYHEITKDMRGLAAVFRSVRTLQAANAGTPSTGPQKFLETGRESEAWAETDLTLKNPDPKKSPGGPLTFGLALTLPVASASPTPAPSPAPSPEETPVKREARVVVIGDSDFATNYPLRAAAGNRDLALNTISWLLADTDLISIRPREEGEQRLKFMRGDFAHYAIVIVVLAVLPGIFIVWGIVTWFRRR
jgi:ABC-type uncharacterized transport system involved in gliding motility auxiliary subunit